MSKSEREVNVNTERKALVTGASGSIGFAIASLLIKEGYAVTVLSRCSNARIDELTAMGAEWLMVDLASQPLEIPESARTSTILVNAAGILLTKELTHEISIAELNETLVVNLVAPFVLCAQVLPFMVQKGWGRIVNIGSIYSLRGADRNSAYNVSKHGLSGLTKTIAKEYANKGITCNEICPAAVDSDLMHRLATNKESEGLQTASEYLSAVATAIPAGRLPRPEDVAEAVNFLVGDEAAMINGSSIPVDGGLIC